MGGFAALLGHAATGFEGARQQDLGRQFADEQNRRALGGEILQKIALDENQHPEVRNAASQAYMNMVNAPPSKAWNFSKETQPIFDVMSKVRAAGQQQPAQQFTPPPAPPMQLGGSTVPGPPTRTITGPPPPPPGLFASAPEVTGNIAQRAGAIAGAQASQEMGGQVYQAQPNGGMSALPIMRSGAPGTPIQNAISPYTLQGRGLDTKPYIDPTTGQLAMGTYNKITRQMFDQDNQVVPNAIPYEPSMVQKTTTGSSTTPGGMTTTKSSTVTPHIRSSAPGGGMTPLPKQGGGTGTSASPKLPPAVSAAMQNIQLYGEPQGKLSDAQAIAVDHLRMQGIDPSILATGATRSMGDKARMIMPLIQQARDLIARDPEALGPLSGRWSELQGKIGDLSGPAKELAGTLVSIYSIAGGMHGWRSLKVADEFENKYGTISSNPQSLNSGLDALSKTANDVAHVAYPGLSSSPPPPPSSGKVISMSAVERAAKDHGVSVDEAIRQAKTAGYHVQ